MNKFPIRYKITLLVGALLIVFFGAMILLTNTIMTNHITDSMVLDTQNILDIVSRHFDLTVEEAEKTLLAMSDASHNKNTTFETYNAFLASIPNINKNIENAYFFYEDGSYIIQPKVELPPEFDHTTREWYQGAIENPNLSYWTKPYYDAATGKLIISVSKTDYTSSIDTKGVIGIDICLEELSNSLNGTDINDYGYLMLIEDNGHIISHKDTSLNDTFIKDPTNSLVPFLQSSETELRNVDGVYLRTRVDLGYNLVGFISQQDVIAVTDVISTVYSILLLVALIIMTIITFFSVTRIISPLESLTKTMQKSITAGQLLLSPEETNDEISVLIDGYNEMATQINEKNFEMTALYEELYASEETLKEQYDQLFESREKLKSSEEKYRLIFEASSEGLWEQRPDNTLKLYTSSWYNQFDIDIDHATYELWLSLIHPDDQKKFDFEVTDQQESRVSTFHSEYRIMTKTGEYMWIASIGRLLFNADGSVKTMIGAHTNITDKKKNEEKILQLAYYDSLTNLHNRFSFKDFVLNKIKSDEKLALLYIDLDNFKYINDTYGHNYGDKVLQQVAERLKSICRKDSVVSRISGDEFAIAITNFKDENDLEDHTQDILKVIINKMIVDDLEFYTTASIGISQYPKDAKTFDELMINADMSMYKAKEANKNGYFLFNESMKEDMIHKLQLENRLLKSIDHNELYLKYQPVIDLQSETINGFESLVRWSDPLLGEIFPDQFIPIAEHNKFIKKIGFFVLKETLKTGLNLYEVYDKYFDMSINVSVVQLQDDEFLNNVKSVLLSYPYPKEHIIFEITESVTIESDKKIIYRLKQFKKMGIKIALDDFGTGYSSLNNLLELPLDHLKIDKSLIDRSTTFAEVSTFIESITTIAHKLGIQVVSEGIENIETLNIARSHSANFVQGYMFSKPIEEEKLEKCITNFKFN